MVLEIDRLNGGKAGKEICLKDILLILVIKRASKLIYKGSVWLFRSSQACKEAKLVKNYG